MTELKNFFVDVHCHLTDPRWGENRNNYVNNAIREGILFFMQGGVSPSEWIEQEKLALQYPHKIGLCFGMHPYWVADHDFEDCEKALDVLSQKINSAMALGEAGLDFSLPHESWEQQMTVFESQLELAAIANKPIVLHLVRSHQEALKVIDFFYHGKLSGFAHSFNGNIQQAKELIERGLMISVGGPVTRTNNQKLHQVLKEIPLEYLLIETDAPDQPPLKYKNQLNPLVSLIDVAEKIGSLRSMNPVEVLNISAHNFRRIFKIA